MMRGLSGNGERAEEWLNPTGDPHDFGNRRHALQNFLDGGVSQRAHALDAAVLRPALLRDVAARKKLHARDGSLIHDLRNHVHVVQHAVDAKAHERDMPLGFEMDV